MNNCSCEVSSIDASMKTYHSLSYPHVEKVFTDSDMQFLREMYELLYASATIVKMSRFFVEVRQISIHGLHLISCKARSQRSTAIVAHWRNQGGIDLTGQAPLRVGIVTSFLCHDIQIEEGNTSIHKQNILARVNWFQDHPKRDQYIPSVIVCSTVEDVENCSCFIPVSRIAARCALISKVKVKFEYGEDYICVCVPLINGILVWSILFFRTFFMLAFRFLAFTVMS